MVRSAAVSLRVEPDVKDALEAAARADGRTMAQYVERLLVSHLRSGGFLADAARPDQGKTPDELTSENDG
jgi:hypothetical protein